jgi:hypothetical protein
MVRSSSVCLPEFIAKSWILITWHQLMRYLTALCFFIMPLNTCWLAFFFLFSLTPLNLLPPAKVAIRFSTGHRDEPHILIIMLLQSLQLCRAPRSILLKIACFYRPLGERVDLSRLLLIDQRKHLIPTSLMSQTWQDYWRVLFTYWFSVFSFSFCSAINFLPFAVFGIDQPIRANQC